MPAPTKDVFDVCKDIFEVGVLYFGQFLTMFVDFKGNCFLSSVFLLCVLGVFRFCKAFVSFAYMYSDK